METTQAVSEYELERGKPMPSQNHAVVQSSIIAALVRDAKEYSILTELSLDLNGNPFVPDISIYPKLDLHPLQDEIKKTEPPVIVIEILSPTQPLDDVIKKAHAYLKAGVGASWLVQPALETVTVLVAGEKPKFYTSGDVADSATGITVNVEEIFRPFH